MLPVARAKDESLSSSRGDLPLESFAAGHWLSAIRRFLLQTLYANTFKGRSLRE
ncbi:hypothetical protein CCP2SC5_500021 [Azospirillaceae bacterium]